jgi:very-short-patch-repair endonuclease
MSMVSYRCVVCQEEITAKEHSYSTSLFNMALCRKHQDIQKQIRAKAENEQKTKSITTESKTPVRTQNSCCVVCQEEITPKVYDYSMKKFGKALCMTHQKTIAPPPPPPLIAPNRCSPPSSINRTIVYSCSVCGDNISGQVYDYSIAHNGAALCMNHQKTVTPHALKLSKALRSYDVQHKLEYSDGHKHVDIAIESAKLFLELDGSQHAFSPKQMLADDSRDKHSQRAGYTTKRIPNAWVDQNVEKLAANIAMLVQKRQYELRDQQKEHAQKITLTGIMKTVISTARKLSETIDDFE